MSIYEQRTVIAARDLKAGDVVDLAGDSLADPRRNHPDYESHYQEITDVEWEGDDCVVLTFACDVACGFPPVHRFWGRHRKPESMTAVTE